MTLYLGQAVQEAQAQGMPVVALESALITHGFAYPANAAITARMAQAIRERGAEPAVVGVWQGTPHVGLTDEQIEGLAAGDGAVKVSVRDLAWAALRGVHGGTTVAATALLAHRARIKVFATGGIGGVHRGHPEDISADLPVLASTPIVVVCAGAKSILDLPRTLEYLETWAVPVVGWQTDEFPAFYSRFSGLPVDVRVDHPEEVAAVFRHQRALALPQAVLVVVPVPAEDALPSAEVEPLIERALAEAAEAGVVGKAVTPFILTRMVALSEDRTRRANESLLIQNAVVAAEIARTIASEPQDV